MADQVTILSPPEPSTPVKQRLRRELDGADMAVDEVDSFIHVCNFALTAQSCDVDADIAVVLNEARGKLGNARERIQNALDLLAEVADG